MVQGSAVPSCHEGMVRRFFFVPAVPAVWGGVYCILYTVYSLQVPVDGFWSGEGCACPVVLWFFWNKGPG